MWLVAMVLAAGSVMGIYNISHQWVCKMFRSNLCLAFCIVREFCYLLECPIALISCIASSFPTPSPPGHSGRV